MLKGTSCLLTRVMVTDADKNQIRSDVNRVWQAEMTECMPTVFTISSRSVDYTMIKKKRGKKRAPPLGPVMVVNRAIFDILEDILIYVS